MIYALRRGFAAPFQNSLLARTRSLTNEPKNAALAGTDAPLIENIRALLQERTRRCNHTAVRQQAFASSVAVATTIMLFTWLFILNRLLSPSDKIMAISEGSLLNRAMILASFAICIPIGLVYCKRVLRLLRRNWLIGLMIIWSGLTYFWASHPDLVLRRTFAFALVYLTVVTLAAAARSSTDLLVPIAAVFTTVLVLNITAMVLFPEISRSDLGVAGIHGNKNGAGTMTTLAIVALVTTLARGGLSLFWRLTISGIICLGWVFLLSTQSKTNIGISGLMMVLGPFIYLVLGSRTSVKWSALAGISAAGAFAAVFYWGMGSKGADLSLMLFGDPTFTGRTEIWDAVISEIARRPWLGHGFGSFWDTGELVNPFLSAALSEWYMDAQIINTAHNGYLDVLLETGIIGFALGVAAIIRCLWILGISVGAAGSRGERILFTGALCLATCLILNNFLESFLFRAGDQLGYFFILLMLHGEAARLRSGADSDHSSAFATRRAATVRAALGRASGLTAARRRSRFVPTDQAHLGNVGLDRGLAALRTRAASPDVPSG